MCYTPYPLMALCIGIYPPPEPIIRTVRLWKLPIQPWGKFAFIMKTALHLKIFQEEPPPFHLSPL